MMVTGLRLQDKKSPCQVQVTLMRAIHNWQAKAILLGPLKMTRALVPSGLAPNIVFNIIEREVVKLTAWLERNNKTNFLMTVSRFQQGRGSMAGSGGAMVGMA